MADLQVAAAAVGNGIALNVLGKSSVAFQLNGTFSATVTFEGTVDQENWIALTATNPVTGTAASTATAAGVYLADCAGLALARARVSTWASGAVTVKAEATQGETTSSVTIGSIAAGTNIIGKVGIDQTTPGTTNQVVDSFNITTIKTTVTRPNDSNAYAANDCFANSTSSPTAGGGTLASAARTSGGTGTITGAIIAMSAASAFQGELWIFDQAATATNDNAALSVSDSDILNLIGVIPFNTTDVNAANAISYVDGLNIDYTCVGTANLRFLVKVMAAFTPSANEVLSVCVKVRN